MKKLHRQAFPFVHKNVVLILIGINISVFVFNQVFQRTIPLLALNPVLFVEYRFYWTVFTYMFVHGSVSHILFNMLALFFFGPPLEHRMGSWEFLTFYLVTGVLSGAFTLLVYMTTGVTGAFLMGASGAIYGVLLAFAVYYPTAQIHVFWFFPLPAPLAVALFGGISLFSQLTGRQGGVAHLTHLSGLAFGYLYFLIRLGIDPMKVFLHTWRRR